MESLAYFFRKGRKTPLVYIPGLGCSRDDFKIVLDDRELREHAVLSIDLPKVGGLEINDVAALVFKLMRQKLAAPAVIIAHSFGSAIALAMIKNDPDAVLGVIHMEGTLDLLPAAKKIASSFEEFLLEWPHKIQKIKNLTGVGSRIYGKQLALADPRAYYDYSRSLRREIKNGRLLKLVLAQTLPHVYLYGSQNTDIHPYIYDLKTAGIPTIELSGCGHFPMHECPKEYVCALRQALKIIENEIKTPAASKKRRAKVSV